MLEDILSNLEKTLDRFPGPSGKRATNSPEIIMEVGDDEILIKGGKLGEVKFSCPYRSEEFLEELESFFKMREDKKRPITNHAARLIDMKLKRNTESSCVEMLRESIIGGWQGLFEPKDTGTFFHATPAEDKFGRMFGRDPGALMTMADRKAIKDLGDVSDYDMGILTAYYVATIPEESDRRRKTLSTLLANFPSELDKALAFSISK